MKMELRREKLVENFTRIKCNDNETLLKESNLEPLFWEPSELWKAFYEGWVNLSKKEYGDNHECAMAYLFDKAVESLTKEKVLKAFANYVDSIGDNTDEIIKNNYKDVLYERLLNYRKIEWWADWNEEKGKKIRSQWSERKSDIKSIVKRIGADD